MKQTSSYLREDSCRNLFQRFRFWLMPVVFSSCLFTLDAQEPFEQTAPGKYRIEFTDKNNNPYALDNPGEFLSQKALDRRTRQNIPLAWNDLPVTPDYVDSLRGTGAKVLTVSKWFNAATIEVTDANQLNAIAGFPFVKKPYPTKSLSGYSPNASGNLNTQETIEIPVLDYGPSWWQTGIHNGHLLHNRGYQGKGMTIAIIDAGFYHVDRLPAFDHLWENDRILGTRDFVNPGAAVFEGHTHGMIVLSVMGGYLPGELIGTAPEASFWLLRSEDGSSEYLIEEDNWIAAVEFADSAGADLINTSLGYTQFNDPAQDHAVSDMDGNTTRISRAADLAASKGMLVVVSAGNQGSSPWKYIGAPADADSVLAVGAIDQARFLAYFSSRGPSADGDVKPDVMAIGRNTYVADYDGGIRLANGTSLSAPLMTGLAACLWQTNPSASALEMLSVIRKSSDRFAQPDDDYGYGIPDFNLASVLLKIRQESLEFTQDLIVFPNPFQHELYIVFQYPVDASVTISLNDLTGKEVATLAYPPFPGREYLNVQGMLNDLPRGIYLMRIQAGALQGINKLIKF